LVDLDHFKSINDRFGHALGDRVLEIFTESAQKSVRATDLVGRLGGEEFAAILVDTSKEKALAVAERIRENFAKAALEVDSRPVGATVSIGLALCTETVFDLTELLAQADHALYVAKERGRNRVEVASLNLMLARAAGAPVSGASSVSTFDVESAA
jgi:diguanylate cyclase (GGDEF)-like protein